MELPDYVANENLKKIKNFDYFCKMQICNTLKEKQNNIGEKISKVGKMSKHTNVIYLNKFYNKY